MTKTWNSVGTAIVSILVLLQLFVVVVDSTEQWNMSAACKLQKSKYKLKKNRTDMWKFVAKLGKMWIRIFKQTDFVFPVQV